MLVYIESKTSKDMWMDNINELEKSYIYYKERMNKYSDIIIDEENKTKKNKTNNIMKHL